MGRLDGKAAIVTGAAGGIGRAIARALAREGAKLVISDIHGEGAEHVAEEIRKAGGAAVANRADISREDDTRAMVAACLEAYGRLDVLVNAAAAINLLDRDNEVASLEVDLWDATFAVNARGTMLACKHAIPHMVDQGGGAIVNISSGAAETGLLSIPAYAASKAAILSLTRSVATQYGKQGVRCNAITPGQILHEKSLGLIPPELVRIDSESILTPRSGTGEDVANAVVFLASEEARFITGHTLPVDGGLLSHIPTYADLRRLGNVSYVGDAV